MDCEMPVLDGFDATREIREIERDRGLPGIPIVALTAHVVSEIMDRIYAVGMNGLISKPIDVDKLIELLDGVLDGLPSDSDEVASRPD